MSRERGANLSTAAVELPTAVGTLAARSVSEGDPLDRPAEPCAASSSLMGTGGTSTSIDDERRKLILYHPDDREYLTDLSCLVRCQLEVFVELPPKEEKKKNSSRSIASSDDHDDGGGGSLAEGRAGIRCVHCASLERHQRAKNAVVNPKAIRLMYQSARNWQRHHLMACPLIPAEVKARFETLQSKAGEPKKRSKSKNRVDMQSYWGEMCARMGLVDTDKGLRLRKAALDGTWTDEMGRDAAAKYVANSSVVKEAAKTNTTAAQSPNPIGLVQASSAPLPSAGLGNKEGAVHDVERCEDAAIHSDCKGLRSDQEIFDGIFTDLDKEYKGGEGMNEVASSLTQMGTFSSGDEGIDHQRRRWPTLYRPEDREHLTELACLVRQQIEVYVLPEGKDPGGANFSSNAESGDLLRAGLRCVHCAPSDSEDENEGGRARGVSNTSQTRGAAFRPATSRLIYQAVRNWQSCHFVGCMYVPRDVRDKYDGLRAIRDRDKGKRSGGIRSYWEESCKRLGLVDTDDGLCLRVTLVNGIPTIITALSQQPQRHANDEQKSESASTFPIGLAAASVQKSAVAEQPVKCDRKNIDPVTFAAGSAAATTIAGSPGVSFENGEIEELFAAERVEANMTMPDQNVPKQSNNDQVLSQLNFTIQTPRAAGLDVGSFASAAEFGGINNNDVNIEPISLKEASLSSNFGRNESQHRGQEATYPLNQHSPHANDDTGESAPDTEGLTGCRNPVDASARQSSHDTSLSTATPSENLLKRVQLAISAVRAMGQIRKFSPSLPSQTRENPHHGDAGVMTPESSSLSMVGWELYTLFAGQRPYELESETSRMHSARSSDSTPAFAGSSEDFGQQILKRNKRCEKRQYAPLRELGLPIALCNIVSTLLDEGNTGDATEYKSVVEVEEDLKLISEQPEKFLFGNPSGNFWIPEDSLYGREEEASKLLDAYEWATNSSTEANSVVLISGFAGAGKSSLVRAMHGQFLEKGACFISSIFDATSQIASFTALAGTLDEYCSIVAQDADRIGHVKSVINAAVGSEGGVLASLIPNVRLVMNVTDDMSPTHVAGQQAMQRLMFLFRTLLRATCSHLNPVVIFLEDLQWADEVSLELISALVTDSEVRGLLFIGSFRDNEVGHGHRLTNKITKMQSSGRSNVTSIHLRNLDKDAVNKLVSDTLQALPRMTMPLSEAIMHKTSGNALFVMQFLASLHDEGLLRFSLATRQWEWDIDRIRSKDVADNVVPLMTTKMLRFEPQVREALRLVAAFGAQSHEGLLCIFDRASGATMSTATILDTAVAEGLMVKCVPGYRFSHDLIQCAAYSLIPQSEQESFHLRLGRMLWQNASAEELGVHLFAVVDQLNRGAEIISKDEEKFRLAQLNLTAGKKAASLSGFLPASSYFKSGIHLISDNDWWSYLETCLDLHCSAAEMDYILGHYENLKHHVGEVLQRPITFQDKLRAYFVLAQSTGAQENTSDAISTCFTMLDQLGEPLPSTVSKGAVLKEIFKTQALLAFKMKDDALSMGTMQNSDKKEAMKFLDLTFVCDFREKGAYMSVIACRMVQLSLRFGLCSESALGFALYGTVVGAYFRNHAAAHRLGKLALAILDRFDAKEYLPQVFSSVYGFIIPWSGEPLSSTLPFLKHAVDVALSIGDVDHAMYNAHKWIYTALHSGYPLDELMDEMEMYSRQMMEHRRNAMRTLNLLGAPRRQFTSNLLGRSTSDRAKLSGEEMDDDILEQYRGEKIHDTLGLFVYYFRSWLAYLFHDYEAAAVAAMKYQNLMRIREHYHFAALAQHTFIYGLSACALARIDDGNKWSEKFKELSARMEKLSTFVPWDCQHKFELMKAEKGALDGNHTEASRLYESAANLASEHHYIQDQALTFERAGMFYLEIGHGATASRLFEKSYKCYMQWGAVSKAAHIKERYCTSSFECPLDSLSHLPEAF